MRHLPLPLTLPLALWFAGFALVLSAAMPAVAAPNIVYVLLDDAGYGDFAAFADSPLHTPHMDRMCREGLRFTHHYSGSAVCAPTRCVLMTGLDPGHCKRRDNVATGRMKQLSAKNKRPLVFLDETDLTVAKALQQAGYVTAGVGKWGLGNPGSAGVPEKQGFDHWFGYLDQVHAHSHYPNYVLDDGRVVSLPENVDEQGDRTYVPDLLEEKSLEFIRKSAAGEKPFFLYLATTLPHSKFEIPAEDPANEFYADRKWSQKVKNYAAMVTRADRTVGHVLDLLKELEIDDETIVFYTSDNGPNAPFVEPLGSGGGLRGIKRDLYEGGIRAPMAVRWPGQVPAGETSDFIWSMVDFLPTACELAGAETPAGLNGRSVLPTLLGQTQEPHEHLYWEIHHPFQQAVRRGPWKAIRFGIEEPVELYDVVSDPGETNDVAAQHPDVVADLTARLDGGRTESPYYPAVTRLTKKRAQR